MKDEAGFADRMNNLPKYVVSTTLTEAKWNNSKLITENIAEEVAKLKQQPGQNILIFGSGKLVHTLMEHHLVDEYQILVYPVVLGSGKPFFKSSNELFPLKLVATKTFTSGVIALSYQLA
jgi:dihydrofolate reductase